MSVTPFGRLADGTEVAHIRLADGIAAELITYGAIITAIEHNNTNLVLALPDLATYETRNPNFGATVGRYAGRIAGGRFSLDGRPYALAQNEGPNTLHGGPRGFAKRPWRLLDATDTAATLAYTSADGEEGFPGTLETRVTFTVRGTTLRLDYQAQTDRPTVLNLTNHTYFNLAGGGDALSHTLQVAADDILELDGAGLPTGTVLSVAGTPFDFRNPTALSARIRDPHPQILAGLGYDCCFLLPGTGLREVACLADPGSGRRLCVRTDQPAVQLYTANKLTGALAGPAGRTFRAGDGVCLETQHYPDSPNRPAFPSTVLRPGETFRSTTEYAVDPA